MDLTASLFYVLENKNRMSNGHLSEYSLAFFWILGYILMPPNPHINQGQYARNNHNCQPQETRMHFAWTFVSKCTMVYLTS